MQDQTHTHYLPAFGRLLLATIFLISGLGKVAAPTATIGYIGSTGAPFPTVGYAIAVAIELGGGLLILLGYKTRVVAAVMAAFAIATAFLFHHAFGDQNQMIHFLKNIAIAGGFLQIVAFGAGSFSLDARARSAGRSKDTKLATAA
jgi:putative oxidoreductase